MKILILSCNTGQGHNSTAAAIKEELVRKGHTCDIEDALRFISPKISNTFSKGHTAIYRHSPKLFEFGYNFSENHRTIFAENTTLYKFFAQGAERLYEFCTEGKYKTVICTHTFPALMITDIQKNFDFKAKTAFVATDYTCSPSTEQSDLDLYFIPDETLTEEFCRYGIETFKIIPSGIPVRSMFYTHREKNSAKNELGINENSTHIVLSCGSMGCGPIKELAKLISANMKSDIELTVVCGTNEKLYKSLVPLFENQNNVHINGYVSDMSLMLDSADLYITKPGGLSVTEAAVKKLPMVLIDAVAGCEKYNMSFFTQKGCAVTADTPEQLSAISLELAEKPQNLEMMRAAYKNDDTVNSAQLICEVITRQM